MAEIIYKAAVDNVPLQNQNKMALQLLTKNLDVGDQDGAYANEARIKLLNYKDDDVTFFDKLNTISASAREGFQDAGKGFGTLFLKSIGKGYKIPNPWQAPSFQEKQIENNKESMGEFGKVLTDASYGIGNLAPTLVLDTIDPGLGLAQLAASTYGQTYNQAKGEGHSEEDAQTYSVISAGANSVLKEFGLLGKGEITNKIITKLAGDSVVQQILLPYIKTAGGAAVAGALTELMLPALQDASMTESNGQKPSKDDIVHAALVYAVMGLAFKGMGNISKKKTALAETETNVENNPEAQGDENATAIDSQNNSLEKIRLQTLDHIQNGIAYDDYTLSRMDGPELKIVMDTLKAANDLDMKNKGYTPEQINRYGEYIENITNQPEMISTIRNWQNEMGFKEKVGVGEENVRNQNLNNLNENDIIKSSKNAKTNQEVFDNLTGREIFANDNAVKHVLLGAINKAGDGTGYHYENMPEPIGRIISGTQSEPNDYGVYAAKVEVNGIPKTANNGESSFFPKNWTAQQVIDAINEAYNSRIYVEGNTYSGRTKEGIRIDMYLDNNNKIISAFPKYFK